MIYIFVEFVILKDLIAFMIHIADVCILHYYKYVHSSASETGSRNTKQTVGELNHKMDGLVKIQHFYMTQNVEIRYQFVTNARTNKNNSTMLFTNQGVILCYRIDAAQSPRRGFVV